MQKELHPGKLLNEKGELNEVGYAKSLVREYNRNHIKAKGFRIKEWDYYIITDGKRAIALTIADNSYMSLVSASFLDFESPRYKTTSEMKFFSFGKLNLPSTYESGDCHYDTKRVNMHFIKSADKRILTAEFKKFDGDKTLTAELTLDNFPKDAMVIATPFAEDKKAFYYNTKINCMRASGYVDIGGERYDFNTTSSLGTLDWGRGVWTYKNTWYWGSLQTYLDDGRTFGFNIGYGFGDTSAASENMIFVDGIAHKTERVTFNIPTDNGVDDFMSPWTFTSDDNRIDLVFVPVIDRQDNTDIKILASIQHQVFGKFSGKVVLDDGSTLTISDRLGFAEKVFNKW
ncbi:MAG: DUF2804 domain-containing protein [Clostridia bacterium]